LEDVRQGRLERRYDGGLAEVINIPPARQDLLNGRYASHGKMGARALNVFSGVMHYLANMMDNLAWM
jgi:hypothetical protein